MREGKIVGHHRSDRGGVSRERGRTTVLVRGEDGRSLVSTADAGDIDRKQDATASSVATNAPLRREVRNGFIVIGSLEVGASVR